MIVSVLFHFVFFFVFLVFFFPDNVECLNLQNMKSFLFDKRMDFFFLKKILTLVTCSDSVSFLLAGLICSAQFRNDQRC